jgi:hypothetical protein
VAGRFSPAGVVPPHLDKNLTDVEKIYAINDWMAYNESKQDSAEENPGLAFKQPILRSIKQLIFLLRWADGDLCKSGANTDYKQRFRLDSN